MVPIAGIGPATSPFPRECSATEPNGHSPPVATGKQAKPSALFKNQSTLERETGIEPASLAWKARVLPLNYSRIEAEPVNPNMPHGPLMRQFSIQYTGGEGWIRTIVLVRGQIYSLLPLTTRPPLLSEPWIMPRKPAARVCVHPRLCSPADRLASVQPQEGIGAGKMPASDEWLRSSRG